MGIWIAAVVTTILSIGLYGLLLAKLAPAADRRWLLVAFLIALPLQPLAFYWMRMPLHAGLTSLLGPGALLTGITLFYAPLTEEPAKWLVLSFVRRHLTPENAIALALTIGLGFGIGELWFIAEQISRAPQYADVPFYLFGGFLNERFIVCFLHGAFMAYAVRQLAEGRSFLLGGLLGMALHFAVNFPIFLIGANAFGWGQQFWATFNAIWFATMLIALGAWVGYLSRGRLRRVVLGTATCPECHALYERPLFGLNLGVGRYERCPQCRHFHLVRVGGR